MGEKGSGCNLGEKNEVDARSVEKTCKTKEDGVCLTCKNDPNIGNAEACGLKNRRGKDVSNGRPCRFSIRPFGDSLINVNGKG